MATRTLALVKPDARQHTEEIISDIRAGGFRILVRRERMMKDLQVEQFYKEHKDQPFFGPLLSHMTSGVITMMVLETDGQMPAWQAWRNMMGSTDPYRAEVGTIRKKYWNGKSLPANVVHGSDSAAAAEREIAFFFAGMDLIK